MRQRLTNELRLHRALRGSGVHRRRACGPSEACWEGSLRGASKEREDAPASQFLNVMGHAMSRLGGVSVTSLRWRRLLLILAVLPLMTACPRRTAIWVVEGSTVDHLTFGVSAERDGGRGIWIDLLRVDRFDIDTQAFQLLWGFEYGLGSRPEVTRIEFGVIPSEARPLKGVADTTPILVPGCYMAWIDGTGEVAFLIGPDGAAAEVSRSACRAAASQEV